ncbi:MAG: phospholipase [Pelomonas sp.]|nr:phospholipase [Roseateles sp.]
MKHFKTTLLVAATSVLVAACGGGTGPTADTTPRANITTVKVFGDSLADVGTFGFKFTVQDGQVYPQRVAAAYGQTLCNFFTFTGTTFAPNTAKSGCTDFAIGGGVINPASSTSAAGAGNPVGIQAQLTVAGSLGFSATDLALIDGGGNDVAALLTAFLTAQQTQNPTGLITLLTSAGLPQAQVVAAIQGGATTTAQIGGAYMVALADQLAASVTANVLGKGATHVAILNLPAVTKTPEFQAVLAQVAAGAGGGTTGAAAAAQVETLAEGWMQAYNAELASKFAGEARVVIVDFYSSFLDNITEPAQYQIDTSGAQGVFTELCPAADAANSTAAAAGWLACTASNLSAQTGHSDPNWWTHYAFANQFHPTPYGHQLVAQLISRSLAQQGWQ